MPWIAAIVAAAGQYLGQRKSAKDSNKAMAGMANQDPSQFNPWLYSALGQKTNTPIDRNTGFYKDLQNIVNGKDTSSWLLNQPLAQLNQGSASNLSKFQGIVGKSNASGGLANGYALANLAGLNRDKANLMQNYGQIKEQQRRGDINNIFAQVGNAQDRAAGRGTQLMNNYQQPMNAFTGFGNLIQGGLAAYGSMGNSWGGDKKPASTVQTGDASQGTAVNSNFNPSGWYNVNTVKW